MPRPPEKEGPFLPRMNDSVGKFWDMALPITCMLAISGKRCMTGLESSLEASGRELFIHLSLLLWLSYQPMGAILMCLSCTDKISQQSHE